MSFLNKLGNSRFLKKEDTMPTPLLLTIAEIREENVAMVNEAPKMKQVVYFAESDKGFVLGKVTGQQIASFLGDPGDNPRAWYGKRIVLYCDPNVTMASKLVGGIRVRAPRGPAATPVNQPMPTSTPVHPRHNPPPPPAEEDDVPY